MIKSQNKRFKKTNSKHVLCDQDTVLEIGVTSYGKGTDLKQQANHQAVPPQFLYLPTPQGHH